MLCRPAGQPFLSMGRPPLDVSLGGARIYSDARHAPGERLKLELLAEGSELSFTAEVVWVEELAAEAPARFDIGLKFVDVDDKTRKALAELLAPLEDQA